MGEATTQADCPSMAAYERRFDSFLTLPSDYPKGAEKLAKCGFYNLGFKGKTKCFWCGVEIGSWSSGEDVWVRHARSMRSCQFVIKKKGSKFVNQVIEEHGEWIDSQRDRIVNVATRMLRPRMDAPVAQTVISTKGYNRDHVKTAIINRFKKLKPDYTSMADLISDVLALQYTATPYHRQLKLPDVSIRARPGNSGERTSGSDNAENVEGDQGHARDMAPIAYHNGISCYKVQSHTQVGMILTSPFKRDGYVAEANEMEKGLQKAGFAVKKAEWADETELKTMLGRMIKESKDSCSVFLLFISSHGVIGHLKCSDGSLIPINNILHFMKENLPAPIPLVMIIQACMGYTTDEGNSKNTDPAIFATIDGNKNKHIVMERPHTLLLSAAANGGLAYRGVYSGAIARQISKANGQFSMEDMHLAAIGEMRYNGYKQVPEKRDTLEHKLILPGKSSSASTTNQDGAHSEVEEATEGIVSKEQAPPRGLDLSPEDRMTPTKDWMLRVEQLTCKICRSSAVSIIFIPCGHLVCCEACAGGTTLCPVCRKDVKGTIRANMFSPKMD